MERERVMIGGIPALVWGAPAGKVVVFVHGKMGSKEDAAGLAAIAVRKGWQTLSFDLPEHGERAADHVRRCDVWQGREDLARVADYAFAHWGEAALFACSLGAYFSLQAYGARPFSFALFQSPIVDMRELVEKMMLWFSVTPERLEAEGEVDTPIDPLRWDSVQYIRAHPAEDWPIPTAILYGGKDDLQSRAALETFAGRFGARLTVAEESGHAFMEPGDGGIIAAWLEENL